MSIPDEVQYSSHEAQSLPGALFQPAEIVPITTPEQLKAISDPLRMSILEVIFEKAHTVKQIADRLKLPPTRLYYHVGELEAVGFVTLVETRLKSGIMEKYYRAAGRAFQVDRRLLALQQNNLQAVFAAVFDPTMDDLSRSFAAGLAGPAEAGGAGASNLVISRVLCSLRKADVPLFAERLKALLFEMGTANEDSSEADLVQYACTIAFYPRLEPAKPEGE